MTTTLPLLPLVGRVTELAAIDAALDRAAAGNGAVLLLAGEGGVGKTRLAQAAAAAAARRSWRVAEGRAYAVETGVPYAVFADALLPLLRRLDPAALAVLTRGAAGELAHFFPTLFPAGAADRDGAGDGKARLYWSFGEMLGRLAARQPLLLVLDNLQWADAASLELLHVIARQQHGASGAGCRLCVVGTYSEAERDLSPLLRSTERSLISLGVARVQRVGPLSRAETAELVRRTFDTDAAEVREFAALLHDWTRGNAFFIDETLKELVESGALSKRDGRWVGWHVEALMPPRHVRDVVLARVERLRPAARAVLELGAVLGARVGFAALRAVAGAPEPELLDALDELCRVRLLVEETGRDSESYEFAHPLVRDTVYAELGRARARLLHGAVAESLEAHYGPAAIAHADELAFHFARTAGGARPKATRYLVEAGHQALGKYADRAAATYFEAALAEVDVATRGGRSDDVPGGVGTLVEALARARQRLGERAAARLLWARARATAAADGDMRRVAEIERRLGVMASSGGNPSEALAHFDAGLRAATAAGAADVELRLQLARANTLQVLGRHADARESAYAARAGAERLGDVSLRARVQRTLLLLHAWTGPVSEARAHGAHAIALAAEARDLTVGWSVQWAMAILSGLTGDAAATSDHLAECERLGEEIRSPVRRLWTAEVSIEYMAGIGEWRAALALADRAIATARVLGERALLPRLLVWTGLIHRGLGDMERARVHVEEAWALSGAGSPPESDDGRAVDVHVVVPAHTGLAGYLVTTGEYARALAVGEAGLAIAYRTGYVAWAIYRLLPFVIESALQLRDYARAARHNARLRQDSIKLGHPLGLAWADTCDAVLAYLTGPPEAAAAPLRAAMAALEAVPFVFDAARLRRMLAHALADAGDHEGAARELRRAHDVFARLGADRELRGTRDQLRDIGSRPPVRVSSAGVAGLSAREAEIARLVASRRSNREIAAALDISPRTVSTHLSNIFVKLQVSSRGELTDVIRANEPGTAGWTSA